MQVAITKVMSPTPQTGTMGHMGAPEDVPPLYLPLMKGYVTRTVVGEHHRNVPE